MCAMMLGIAASIAGSVVSAIGAQQQAESEAQQAEYNAKVEKINARQNRFEGGVEQERIAEEYEDILGEQTAGYGASGVDPFFGSALAVYEDTHRSEGTDKSTAYISAESAATANENKATQYEFEAREKRKAGKIAAFSSILGGIGGAAKGLGGGGGFGSTLSING